MQLIKWQEFIKKGLRSEKKTSVTIGIFDGVHLGHQALINKIVTYDKTYLPLIITFRKKTKPGLKNVQKDIITFKQRLTMFKKLGIQITIVIDFTESFKQMPGIEFLEILLKRGNIGFFAVGNNFRCGCNLDTDAAAIKSFFNSQNIPAEIIPEVMEGSLPVSSSRIREAIAAGDTALANKMLGKR